jgi:hypothetical protein
VNPTAALTNKIGPLPAWAWGGMAGGALLAWRVWRARKTAALEAPVPSDGQTPQDPSQFYDTSSLLPASSLGGAASPDLGGVDVTPPDWMTNPPSWFYELPGLLLNQPPINLVLPDGAVGGGSNPASGADAPAAPPPPNSTKRTVGPWSTKGARDANVAGIPPAQVRKWSAGGKFYADIFTPLRATVSTPAGVAAPVPVTPHAAPPQAPNPTKRTVGPWTTAAARDSAVAGIDPARVRKWSNGPHAFYADVWS